MFKKQPQASMSTTAVLTPAETTIARLERELAEAEAAVRAAGEPLVVLQRETWSIEDQLRLLRVTMPAGAEAIAVAVKRIAEMEARLKAISMESRPFQIADAQLRSKRDAVERTLEAARTRRNLLRFNIGQQRAINARRRSDRDEAERIFRAREQELAEALRLSHDMESELETLAGPQAIP